MTFSYSLSSPFCLTLPQHWKLSSGALLWIETASYVCSSASFPWTKMLDFWGPGLSLVLHRSPVGWTPLALTAKATTHQLPSPTPPPHPPPPPHPITQPPLAHCKSLPFPNLDHRLSIFTVNIIKDQPSMIVDYSLWKCTLSVGKVGKSGTTVQLTCSGHEMKMQWASAALPVWYPQQRQHPDRHL